MAALIRARQVDERIAAVRTAGVGTARRIDHADLVDRYLADLAQRRDAGEVAVKTVGRYRAALGHYLAFCSDPAVRASAPTAARVGRDFRLGFAAFLAARVVTRNGRSGSATEPMRGASFVQDAVRGMYEWALDPDRGGLLPDGFRNPFLRTGGKPGAFRGDPLADPAITADMAVAFVRACDDYEARLFVPMILFGLRAAEPSWLCREFVRSDCLSVPNVPDLDYLTKGRRDKRFPLPNALASFWAVLLDGPTHGLLFTRRNAVSGAERAPLFGASLDELVAEYRRRLRLVPAADRIARMRTRDKVMREAGGLTYDDIDRDFRRVKDRLGWPRATLKDFRHLFATTLAAAGVPDAYRKYWMGHAPGRDAVVAYTHLTALEEQFDRVVRERWGSLVETVRSRFESVARDGPAEPATPQVPFASRTAPRERRRPRNG